MWDEITAWEQAMMGHQVTERTRLQYSQDARRFAAWVYQHTRYRSIADITISDSWKYWQVLQDHQHAEATIRRAFKSLHLFTTRTCATTLTPFRVLLVWEQLRHHLATALSPDEWQAVQQETGHPHQRDHGLAHALVQLTYYTGLHPRDLVNLQRIDLVHTGTRAFLTVGPMRQLPLEDRAYHALIAYWEAMDALLHVPSRREKHHTQPHGNGASTRAFIGQRGPFTERAIRLTFAQVGQAIHRQRPMIPSHVQASFLIWIFAPRAYECTWDGTLLTMIDDALHQSSMTRGEGEDYDLQWFVGVVQDAFRQDA